VHCCRLEMGKGFETKAQTVRGVLFYFPRERDERMIGYSIVSSRRARVRRAATVRPHGSREHPFKSIMDRVHRHWIICPCLFSSVHNRQIEEALLLLSGLSSPL
jgi:hypothetical protein